MSKRIGELLLERGLVTAAQLDQALKAQLIFGGHLGTCLIELGCVDEEPFGRALADFHGLRYASAETLRRVPEPVIRIFNWKMAEKSRAVPIQLEDKTLHLAVIDPLNLGRLSTLTGYKIVPWIAPEFRILEAMARFYDLPLRERYVNICHLVDRKKPAAEPTVEPLAESEPVELGDSDAAPGSHAVLAADLGAEYGYGRSWRDVADELFESGPRDCEETRSRPDRPESPRPPELIAAETEEADVFGRMSRATGVEDLSRIVLQHLGERMTAGILFTVKAETAAVWDWNGSELDRERVTALRFPLTAGSIFALMLGDGYYLGPVPDRHDCLWFFETMHHEVPAEVLLMPVYLDDRLVVVLYGDAGPRDRIRGSVDDFLVLSRKMGLALKMLVLKSKIAATR